MVLCPRNFSEFPRNFLTNISPQDDMIISTRIMYSWLPFHVNHLARQYPYIKPDPMFPPAFSCSNAISSNWHYLVKNPQQTPPGHFWAAILILWHIFWHIKCPYTGIDYIQGASNYLWWGGRRSFLHHAVDWSLYGSIKYICHYLRLFNLIRCAGRNVDVAIP